MQTDRKTLCACDDIPHLFRSVIKTLTSDRMVLKNKNEPADCDLVVTSDAKAQKSGTHTYHTVEEN